MANQEINERLLDQIFISLSVARRRLCQQSGEDGQPARWPAREVRALQDQWSGKRSQGKEGMVRTTRLVPAALCILLVSLAGAAHTGFQASDPGVRSGDPGAGTPLDGLKGGQLPAFTAGKHAFEAAEGLATASDPDLTWIVVRDVMHNQPPVGQVHLGTRRWM